MGIADVRNAFIAAAAGRARFDSVTLVHVQDKKNSQQIDASGFLSDGAPFAWSSGAFPAATSPIEMAREMVKEKLG